MDMRKLNFVSFLFLIFEEVRWAAAAGGRPLTAVRVEILSRGAAAITAE